MECMVLWVRLRFVFANLFAVIIPLNRMCLNQILDLYIAVPKTQTEFIRFTYSISISTIFCVLAYLKG